MPKQLVFIIHFFYQEHSTTLKNNIRSKIFATIKTPDPSIDIILKLEYYAPSELGLRSAEVIRLLIFNFRIYTFPHFLKFLFQIFLSLAKRTYLFCLSMSSTPPQNHHNWQRNGGLIAQNN